MISRHDSNSDKLCELLPWYVNDTLASVERQSVEDHLDHCQTCAEELPVLRSTRRAIHAEPVTVLPLPNTKKFLAEINSNASRRSAKDTAWLAGAIAASVLLLAFALFWVQPRNSTTAATEYKTVIGPNSGQTYDYVLLITVDQNLAVGQQLSVLRTLEPRSIAGPDEWGEYRVVMQLPAHSLQALEDYRQNIESNSGIQNVTVVAVELPVESR